MGLLDNWGASDNQPITAGLLAPYPAGLMHLAAGNQPDAELRAYQPTPREWLQGKITSLFGGGRDASRDADKVMSLLDLTPAGAPLAAYDAGHQLGAALRQGDPAQIGAGLLGIGLAAAPAAPFALLANPELLGATLRAAEQPVARHVFMYDPPDMPPRPFAADYPSGAPADVQGNLTHDVEGRPLTAPYIAGRRVVGGPDNPLPGSDLNAVGTAGTGQVPTVRPAREMGQDAGRTTVDAATKLPLQVQLRSNLADEARPLVLAHEIGHVIDQLAGEIGTKGLLGELRANYNTLNNPNRLSGDRSQPANWGKPATPQALGYKGDDVSREYMVEAIRAYLSNPNYLKTVAPKTAAVIRAAVNANPRLSKIIQFNGVAAAPITGRAFPQTDEDNR